MVCGLWHTINVMEKIITQPINQLIYQRISAEIIAGTFKPKQALSERDLAKALGVSRTPVREALQMLEIGGFAEKKSRVGWTVSVPNSKTVQELLEMRFIFESLGIDKLLSSIDYDGLHMLASIFDKYIDGCDDSRIDEYLADDSSFHNNLINATNNFRIIDISKNVSMLTNWIRHLISFEIKSRIQNSLQEHLDICKALSIEDAERAKQCLKVHLGNVGKEYTHLLETTLR